MNDRSSLCCEFFRKIVLKTFVTGKQQSLKLVQLYVREKTTVVYSLINCRFQRLYLLYFVRLLHAVLIMGHIVGKSEKVNKGSYDIIAFLDIKRGLIVFARCE